MKTWQYQYTRKNSLVRVVGDEGDVRSRNGLGELASLANVLAHVLSDRGGGGVHIDNMMIFRRERERERWRKTTYFITTCREKGIDIHELSLSR